MRILFFDTKNYDRASFDKQLENYPGIEIDYLKTDLAPKTAPLAKGFDAVCAFVSSDVGAETMTALHEAGVRLVLGRVRHPGYARARLLSGSRGGTCHGAGSYSKPQDP